MASVAYAICASRASTEHVGGTENALRDVVFRALIWSGKFSAFGA
jgi:hypothetical protein